MLQVEGIREQVLQASIEMYEQGLVASVWGNLSARVPDSQLAIVN